MTTGTSEGGTREGRRLRLSAVPRELPTASARDRAPRRTLERGAAGLVSRREPVVRASRGWSRFIAVVRVGGEQRSPGVTGGGFRPTEAKSGGSPDLTLIPRETRRSRPGLVSTTVRWPATPRESIVTHTPAPVGPWPRVDPLTHPTGGQRERTGPKAHTDFTRG